MSTLEKTIDLLESLPDNKLETVYAFVRFINSDAYEINSGTYSISPESATPEKRNIRAMIGMAQEYANPALIEQEEGAFERAMVKKYAADRR